ncbi:hypothetical protein [Paraburkholderia hospita]|uniref:hypothetical protein n=1 Tax=Paraburkholderia hospita TaxID=169430 RepID=UPI001F61F60F|nr:hypothetical protein [Paraburkholderia hospita]
MSNRRAMVPVCPSGENVVERVDSLCLQLFDTWCETSNVTPLAYLLHCWPLTDNAPDALRRVGETMRYLRRHHADQLDAHGLHALCEMADLIDELVEHPARTVRLMAVGEVPE